MPLALGSFPLIGHVKPDHYLAQVNFKAAKQFSLGSNPISINLDRTNQAAASMLIPLSPKAVSKLGRSEDAIEGIANGITSRTALGNINTYLTQLKFPQKARQESQFFFVTARRKNTSSSDEAFALDKDVGSSAERQFILGFYEESKNLMLSIILPNRHGALTLYMPALTSLLDVNRHQSSGDTKVDSYADDPAQDFAGCYSECLSTAPDWLTGVVTAFCGGCVATLALAAASVGVSTAVTIAVCASCAVAVGIVLGNCLLTCHEML
jgi:hypothetical protein